jgi:rRNA maturation RNase YbeY
MAKNSIRFSAAPRKNFPSRDRMKACLTQTAHRFGIERFQLQYIFVDDEALLEMNRNFLQHDYYTDIITFNLSESVDFLEGEIYISFDRIHENARINFVPVEEEFCRVMAHGLLHLCGLNDHSASEKAKMREAEEAFLLLYKDSE